MSGGASRSQSKTAVSGAAAPDSAGAVPVGRQIEQLALITVAIVFGLLGFALHFLWFLAVLVLVLVWGLQASGLRGARRSGGMIAAVAGAAVAEAREIAAEVGGHVHPDLVAAPADPTATGSTPPSAEPAVPTEPTEPAERAELRRDAAPGDNPRAEATKAELYEKAREADIPGRSAMSKDELRQALEG